MGYPDVYLRASLIGFFAAVFVYSYADFGYAGALLALLVGVGCVFIPGATIDSDRTHVRSRVKFVALAACVGVVAGIVRIEISDRGSATLRPWHGETLALEGLVMTEPEEEVQIVRFILEVVNVNSLGVDYPAYGRVLVTGPGYERVMFGDTVRVSGTLLPPERIRLEDAGRFSYAVHLAKDRVFSRLAAREIVVLAHGGGSIVRRGLFSIKRAFLTRIQEIFPEPSSSLLAGLILGEKGLSNDLEEAFRRAGVVHVVVLSGYNISLVADAVQKITAFLPRVLGLASAGVAIILFGIMTGGSATAVRAVLMALVLLVAKLGGRRYAAGRALGAAAFLMVLHDPLVLAFDSSFQLSFLATAGLIYVTPIVPRAFPWLRGRGKIKEIIATTLATQLLVVPLLLYRSGDISLVALPANVFILWAVPGAMLFGAIAAATGFISPILALPLALPAFILLVYIIKAARMFAAVPLASLTEINFSLFFLVLSYGAIFIIIRMLRVRTLTAVPSRDTLSIDQYRHPD